MADLLLLILQKVIFQRLNKDMYIDIRKFFVQINDMSKVNFTGNEVINFYTKVPDKMKPKYHNPNYEKHYLKIPFRALLLGPSSAGKTNILLNIIHKMSGTFEQIYICVKSANEPLYNYLASKIPENLHIFEDGKIPDIKELQDEYSKEQILMVFDDLVLEKNQSMIQQYFIRGRKVAGGISSVYITQSYYKVPKTIRIQCNYIFMKSLSSQRDLKMILNEYSLGVDLQTMVKIYKYAVSGDKFNFLLIDTDAPDSDKFRRNFLETIEP